MRVAIISDTHFGDKVCALVKESPNGGYQVDDKFDDFLARLGEEEYDYLILLGDVFDFSVASYAEAYETAKVFFTKIPDELITEAFIYVPGNHDFEFWHWVENDVNIVRQITEGNPPRKFHWSLPGIIDCRKKNKVEGFYLPEVRRKAKPPYYRDLFLNELTKNKKPFYVAYPNIYLLTDEMTILVTHGHYLELWWSMLGDLAQNILGGDLDIGGFLDLKELVAINFLTNQMASSGVGQTGPLRDCIRDIQRKVKDGQIEALRKYIHNLDENVLDPYFNYRRFDPRELATDTVISIGKRKIMKMLNSLKDSRYSKEFVNDPAVLSRFKTYYLASVAEIESLNGVYELNKPTEIPKPNHVIFGHTHYPIPWSDNHLKTRIEGTTVRLHNTGGWLFRKDEHGNKYFVGAEIFIFDDGQMESVSIA